MSKPKKNNVTIIKIGRDAITGHFKPVEEAKRQSATSTVETIKIPKKKK